MVRVFALSLFCIALLGGCVSPPPPVDHNTDTPAATVPEPVIVTNPGPRLLVPGDVLEVRYYQNSRLEPNAYTVGAGDILSINVYDHPEISREGVLVLPDGYVSLPLIGRFSVAGKNVDEIGQGMSAVLNKQRILSPQVTVAIAQADRRIQTLLGSLTLEGSLPALRIKLNASGFINLPFIEPVTPALRTLHDIQTEIRDKYQQVFGGRLEVVVNLSEAMADEVFVFGEVSRPGRVEMRGPLNLLRAVAGAGGFKDSAEESDVRLARFDASGQLQQWHLDFKNDPTGERRYAQTQLQPGDVIFVPKSGIAIANQTVEQYIRKMMPFNFSVGYDLNSAFE